MYKNKLKSQEDLSGYISSLNETFNLYSAYLKTSPSFSGNTETIIEDLMSQLIDSRKKCLETVKIAKKFYKSNSYLLSETESLKSKNLEFYARNEELYSRIESQQREIESKEDRIERMSTENTEMEKEIKSMGLEMQKLKKEVDSVKKTENKRQPVYRNSLMKTNHDAEEFRVFTQMIDDLKYEVSQKNIEIEELNHKIKDLENSLSSESNSLEKIKVLVNAIKKENSELKDKVDENEYEINNYKENIENLNKELIKQKNHYENVIKEYEKERRTSSVAFQSLSNELLSFIEEEKLKDESVEKIENFKSSFRARAPKLESLGDIIDEDSAEEDDFVGNKLKKQPFTTRNNLFVLTSPVVNYDRKFNFPDLSKNFELEIDSQPNFEVFNKKIQNLEQKATNSQEVSLKIQRFEEKFIPEKIFNKINSSELHVLSSTSHQISIAPKRVKKLGKFEIFSNFIEIKPTFKRNSVSKQNASVISNEKYLTRDPIKDFFTLVCQTIKLNSLSKDKIGKIPVERLYNNAIQENVPFNMWEKYIKDCLKSKLGADLRF